MMPARARNASLASPGVGKAAATSGSSTTTTLPAVYRDAYLLGRALLKSYSGRISSVSTELAGLLLLSVFFIFLSLPPCGRPRANNANSLATLNVHDCQQTPFL